MVDKVKRIAQSRYCSVLFFFLLNCQDHEDWIDNTKVTKRKFGLTLLLFMFFFSFFPLKGHGGHLGLINVFILKRGTKYND